MKNFYLHVDRYSLPFINQFRKDFNFDFKRPLEIGKFNYVNYSPWNNNLELTGTSLDNVDIKDEISLEEFIRFFYNEKSGIKQPNIYELW